MIYILAWVSKKHLSAQDNDGYTAMHLAVKTAEKIDSTRPVRALLYRSAPINIPDNKGNLPIDVSYEIKS